MRMDLGNRCPGFPRFPPSDPPLCLLLAELTVSLDSKGASGGDAYKVSPKGHRVDKDRERIGAWWID